MSLTQSFCCAPEKLKLRLLLLGTLSFSTSYHLFYLSSLAQPCCPVENFALCLCQAFIEALLFDFSMSALPIIEKKNSPSVSSSFR